MLAYCSQPSNSVPSSLATCVSRDFLSDPSKRKTASDPPLIRGQSAHEILTLITSTILRAIANILFTNITDRTLPHVWPWVVCVLLTLLHYYIGYWHTRVTLSGAAWTISYARRWVSTARDNAVLIKRVLSRNQRHLTINTSCKVKQFLGKWLSLNTRRRVLEGVHALSTSAGTRRRNLMLKKWRGAVPVAPWVLVCR